MSFLTRSRLARTTIAFALLVSLLNAVLLSTAEAAPQARWATGSFKTYKSDTGPVDSTVTYWIHYTPQYNNTARINYLFVHESPTRNQKLFIQYCYASTCERTYKFLDPSEFTWVEPKWTVRLGSRFTIKVTNSWDPTGVWGETWQGYVTVQ